MWKICFKKEMAARILAGCQGQEYPTSKILRGLVLAALEVYRVNWRNISEEATE